MTTHFFPLRATPEFHYLRINKIIDIIQVQRLSKLRKENHNNRAPAHDRQVGNKASVGTP